MNLSLAPLFAVALGLALATPTPAAAAPPPAAVPHDQAPSLTLAPEEPLPAPARQQDDALRRALGETGLATRWIYDDWEAARARAASSGQPIFALFRCVP